LITLTSSSLANSRSPSMTQNSYYSNLLSILRGVKLELRNQIPMVAGAGSPNQGNQVNINTLQQSNSLGHNLHIPQPFVKQFDNQYLKRLLSGLNTLEKSNIAAMPQKQNPYYDRLLFGLNPSMQGQNSMMPLNTHTQSAPMTMKHATPKSSFTKALQESQKRAAQILLSKNQPLNPPKFTPANAASAPALSLPSYYDGLLNSFPVAPSTNPEAKVTVYDFVPGPNTQASAPAGQPSQALVKKTPVKYYAG